MSQDNFGWDMGAVIQEWVVKLPLRYQGVLVSSVRGCDTARKDDPVKLLARSYRATILVSPAEKPSSFMDFVSRGEVRDRMAAVLRDCDHLPHHYLMHLTHAAEIVGYHYPENLTRACWKNFYIRMCHQLHVTPENSYDLALRLTANESTFKTNS